MSDVANEALTSLEKIEEEAADMRWPVDVKTVEDSIEKFESLKSDDRFEEEYIEDILDDLNKIKFLVDGAPKKSVDSTAVGELCWEFEEKLWEMDILS